MSKIEKRVIYLLLILFIDWFVDLFIHLFFIYLFIHTFKNIRAYSPDNQQLKFERNACDMI